MTVVERHRHRRPARDGQAHRGASDRLAARLTGTIARQAATRRLKGHWGGSAVYALAPGWELDQLAGDDRIAKPRTGRALDQALADPDLATILIPADAALDASLVQACLERAGLAKTVIMAEARA